MHGIGGYQQNLMYQDGIYGGLMVAVSTGLNVRVSVGLARVGGSLIEQTPAGAGTNITVPDDATTFIYVNHPNAKNGAGSDIGTFDIVKEADQTRMNFNGSQGVIRGRSFLLAKVVSAGGAITSVDNTVRLQLANIPPTMWGESLDA